MSKPTVKGAGDSHMAENPHVTSKFDRDHGQPRTPGKVSHPGGTAEPTFAHTRVGPSSSHHDEHGKVHRYEPHHPVMGGLHHGTKAKHPTHDAKQASYEGEHGYNGGYWPLGK